MRAGNYSAIVRNREEDVCMPNASCNRRPARLAGSLRPPAPIHSASHETDVGLELLAQVGFFAGLEEGTLRWLAGQTRQASARAGELIIRQGDAADGLYVIIAGRFGIWVADAAGDVHVRALGPGEIFGEMALLTREPRSASVRCEVDGRLLYLDQRPFRELLHRDADIAGAIAATFSRWLRTTNQTVLPGVHHVAPSAAGATSAEVLSAREAEVLRLLAGGKSNPEIADVLVLSRFTVNRHISNIFIKIGAANRVEATTYAFRHGLL